ncbi:hypothetical protein ACWCPG_33545, partial [Streptomyces sp. NPDC001919]
MSEEPTAEPSAGGPTDRSEASPALTSPPDATGAPEGGSRGDGPEQDGPVSADAAMRSLQEGTAADDAERSDAQRAGAIADLIARRLNDDASGTRIGTLALFNDTVSFGGGFNAGGERHARAGHRGGGTVPLGAAELVDHTELFVQPAGYASALSALSEHRLLVLTGPSGSGREATAVNLLAEALALGGADGGGVCHRLLDPAAVLAPDWEPPVKDSGYLLAVEDGRAGARDFEALPRRLPAVVAALRHHGCHLVLTGGQDLAVTVRADGTESVAVHALTPVDPLAVLERRVLGHG